MFVKEVPLGKNALNCSTSFPNSAIGTAALAAKEIDYKFNEGEILKEVTKYVNSTYDQHYAKNKIQQLEVIIDQGHGTGFCIGNIGKYSGRYGKKVGEARKDLMKVIHYAIVQLYIHDMENKI